MKIIGVIKTIKNAGVVAFISVRLHSFAVMLAYLSCTFIWGEVPLKN